MDSFTVTRNGSGFFSDGFGDGIAPPSAPNFAGGTPASYGTTGAFTESGDRLVIDSSGAVPILSTGTLDTFVGQVANLRTDVTSNLAAGLKLDDDFTVEGRFDLIIPDDAREVYGIRLSDRLVNGPVNPPDQPGHQLRSAGLRSRPECSLGPESITAIPSASAFNRGWTVRCSRLWATSCG
jgi:hypothetical protein